jgi:hypothetical protein
MRKILAVFMILLGIYSLLINLFSAGGDGSKIGAAIGVSFMLIALGAWLWSKPVKKQTEQS